MRADGRVLAGGAVLAALVVAAVAPAEGVLTSGLELDATGVRAVRVGGMLAIVAGAVLLAVQRGRIRDADPRRRDPSAAGLGIAAGLIVTLAMVGLLNPPAAMQRDALGPGAGGGPQFGRGAELPGNPQRDLTDGGASMAEGERMRREMLPGVQNDGSGEEPAVQRVGRRIANTLLLLLAALAAWRLLANTVGRGVTRADPLEEDVVEGDSPGIAPVPDHLAALDRLLAELRSGSGTPSRTVQLTYEALLAAFAALGAERRPEEAPHEHLRRTVAGLGLERTPPHRLAGLHVADRFGSSPVTGADGTAARTALDRVLGDLRGRLDAAAAASAPGTSPAEASG